MPAINGKKLTPEHFIPLAEAAKLSGSKPNCLRKHRVKQWEDLGWAHKDPKGNWWVDPQVIETIRPVKSMKTRVAACPELPGMAGTADLPMGNGGANQEIGDPGEAADLAQAIRKKLMGATDNSQLTDTLFPADDLPGNQGFLVAAVNNLMELRPVPWELIGKLVKQYARQQ